MKIKENNDFFQNIYPHQIYLNYDNLKHIEQDYNFNKNKLTPFCFGGLSSVEFKIKVEVEYKMKRKKSSFELPIQFYDDYYANNLEDNLDLMNEQNKNKKMISTKSKSKIAFKK